MASHSSASSTLLVYDVGHMKFWQTIKRPPCAAELPLTCPIQIDHFVMAITSADANGRHNCHRCCKNHECRENDDSGNSRTCFGAHRARRDDCRCGVGRD